MERYEEGRDERSERKNDLLWRISVTAGLLIIFTIWIVTVGCGDNRITPASSTGPNITSITTTTTLDSSTDPDLKLVKQYNSDSAGGRVTRWNKSVVTVYDSTGGKVLNLQSILNEWNAVLGGKLTLITGDSGSDITIISDDRLNTCGFAVWSYSFLNNEMLKPIISINFNSSSNPNYCASNTNFSVVILHEIGHTLGFFGEARDRSVMDNSTVSSIMSDDVHRFFNKLYALAPGTIIT